MKTTLTIYLCASIHFGIFSQSSLENTVQNLKNSTLFSEAVNFKTTFEKQTETLGKMVKTYKDYQTLQKNYLAVAKPYDMFLKEMKKDFLKNNSKSTSAAYVAKWEKIKKEYNNNFLSFHNAQIGGKGLSDELLKIGKDLLITAFTNIKNRVKDKNETLNKVLSFVNDNFFNKIELKTWAELNISPKAIADANITIPQNQPVEIPAATLTSLSGKIVFAKVENGQEHPMNFQLNQGKDIIIENNTEGSPQESENKEDTQIMVDTSAENSVSYKAPYLESIEHYGFDTKFRLKSESSAFVYVIVLNSTGVVLLHPNVNYAQQGKDITISNESNPTVGAITIPTNGLFTISKSGTDTDQNTSEDFAILISKSELNFTELIEKLNAASGQMDERIAAIFANQQITYPEAGINMVATEIQFQYNGDKNVLPMVFKLNKRI